MSDAYGAYDYTGWTDCPECGAKVHNSATGWRIHKHIRQPGPQQPLYRQPSTRTAEPPDAPEEMDTVQGREAWEAGWYAEAEAAAPAGRWCVICPPQHHWIEAAAPAGLDVEALAQAIHQNYSAVCPNHPMERCPYTRSTRSGAVDFMARAEKIAAEYARLRQGTDA